MAETGTLRLEQLAQDVVEIKGDVRRLTESVARLTGITEQLSQRVGNIEQNQRWVLGLIFGTWITLMLAILLKG
ncbi:MAG: hypothetical protein HYW07_16975 [Candidatus Latescibacteria bacterium]|nr:hypothetical protein [Candidatus Latescibacterota bacterium]